MIVFLKVVIQLELVLQEYQGLEKAVDESGVHPLLLAVGSERYTPYNPVKQPQEILTIALLLVY